MTRHPVAVAVAAAFLLLSGCGGQSGAPATSPDEPQPSPDTTGSPSDALGPGRAIATGIAATPGLVLIDTSTGEVRHEYEVDAGQGIHSLAYSPARGSVFFARAVSGASREIVEFDLADRDAQVVAGGYAVAVAADGERLAVAQRVRSDHDTEHVELQVRSPAGEVLGRWRDPVRPEEPTRLSHLTWRPDGQRLAFQATYEDGTEVRVLDPTAESGSLHASSHEVPASGDLRMLTVPEYRPTSGRLTVVDGPGLDPEAAQRWRVLELEADTFAVRRTLTTTQRAVSDLDFDDRGEGLLYVERHGHVGGDDSRAAPPVLSRWHDGTSRRVRAEVTEATW